MNARFLLLLVLAGCISRVPMSGRDWLAQGTLLASSAVDYAQTRHIVAANQEINPFVGSHGQRMDPLAFGALALVLELGISMALDPEYRVPFEYTALGAEGYVVYNNFLDGWCPW